MRNAALRAAAAKHAPEALPSALKAVRDGEASERLAGIAALGTIGGGEARAELRAVAQREAEVYQAAAVAELGKLADLPAVYEAAGDKSWRVRRAAAAALASDTTARGVSTARKLLVDPAAQVQQQIVAAVSEWPLEIAGPLLLAGLESRAYATRGAALAALAERWPAATAITTAELQPLSPPRAKIARLRQAWAEEFGSEGLRRVEDDVPTTDVESEKTNGLHGQKGNAVEAVGDAPPSPYELKQQLGGSDKHARLSAATALLKLGDAGGSAVLESLTFDRDPEIRRAAASAIGTLPDSQFLPALIRLLDDAPAVRLAALKSLPRLVGRNVAAAAEGPSLTAPQQAERWKEWYRLSQSQD